MSLKRLKCWISGRLRNGRQSLQVSWHCHCTYILALAWCWMLPASFQHTLLPAPRWVKGRVCAFRTRARDGCEMRSSRECLDWELTGSHVTFTVNINRVDWSVASRSERTSSRAYYFASIPRSFKPRERWKSTWDLR